MLKSFRFVLFVVLLLSGFAGAQNRSDGDPGNPVAYGTEGEPGSYFVKFDKRGAGIFSLALMDHWQSVESRNNDPHTAADYMLLVYDQGNDYALRLAETGSGRLFEKNLMVDAWDVREFDGGIEFTIRSEKNLVLRKTLRHVPEERGFELTIALRNEGADPATGANATFELFGPWLANPSHTTLVGNSSVAVAVTMAGDAEKLTPAAGKLQTFEEIDPRAISFAGTTSRFFGAFLYPRDEMARNVLTGFVADTGPLVAQELTETAANSVMRLRYQMALPVPTAGNETVATYGLYLGPKSTRVFETLPPVMQDKFAPVIDVDLAGGCCIEIPGARQVGYLLLSLLGWFYDFVGNWGVAIIMLTVLVRGLLMPLNFRMQKSMRAYSSKMAVLKPKLDKLKEQHADDPKAYQQAMLAFQREHKIMPPIGGCLPIFLTMPVYIGLFTALRTAYDLRQQPFMFWIQDLSLSDALFELPFWPGVFNLLPLLWMGLFLYLSTRQPLPTDEQQRSIQKMMRLMPLIMGVMLYGYASALLLYMVTSMVWSLAESSIIKKILGPVDPNVAAMTPTPM